MRLTTSLLVEVLAHRCPCCLEVLYGIDHRPLCGRFFFSSKGEKAGEVQEPRFQNHYKQGSLYCIGQFVEGFYQRQHRRGIRSAQLTSSRLAKKAESLKVTKRRFALETLELIRQRGAARAAGNLQLASELAKRCREATKEDFKERRVAVLAEAAEAGQSIRNARHDFANHKARMTALQCPDGTITASGDEEGHPRLLL